MASEALGSAAVQNGLLRANEQQKVEEFFDHLWMLVLQRLALLEHVNGRDISTGNSVTAEDSHLATGLLAFFDARLWECMNRLEGRDFLKALGESMRAQFIDRDVRFFEGALNSLAQERNDFWRSFETSFPPMKLFISRNLSRLRRAIEEAQPLVNRKRPAFREAAIVATSSYRNRTVRERTIKSMRAKYLKAAEQWNVSPAPVPAARLTLVDGDGEPAAPTPSLLPVSSRRNKKS